MPGWRCYGRRLLCMHLHVATADIWRGRTCSLIFSCGMGSGCCRAAKAVPWWGRARHLTGASRGRDEGIKGAAWPEAHSILGERVHQSPSSGVPAA